MTRRETSAFVLADLGFKPAHLKVPSRHPWLQGHSSILGQRSNSAYGCFPPAVRQGRRIGRVPSQLASRT